jgi:uncharacterized protein (TIGR02145 family)
MNVAGGKMKATGTTLWQNSNVAATNESGFTGLPGGSVNPYLYSGFGLYGSFVGIGLSGMWWSSTYNSFNGDTSYCILNSGNGNVIIGQTNTRFGFAVRCVKD